MEKRNKNKIKRLCVDPTFFIIYGQEKVKHSLGAELLIVANIAILIMGHDLKDCGMTSSELEINSTDM
jgi:hypothetical protein